MKILLKCGAALLSLVMVLSACAPPTPALRPEAIYTAAAETMEFKLTLAAGQTAVALLTQMAHTPTPEPALPTLPPPLPTFTSQPPTPTYTPVPPTPIPQVCDLAGFVGDVSVPAFATFTPGANLIKTWRVQNLGECTWSSAYSLIFANGDAMNSPSVVGLTGTVRPGESVDISVALRAPLQTGYYQGRWVLRNASNQLVDIQNTDQNSLSVNIQVVPLTPASGSTFDLASSACDALWRSASRQLGCPGRQDDRDGAVMLLTQPNLESRRENELALWLRPNQGSNGSISGEFPAYRIQDGDHFVSEIGCLADSPRCDLTFRLDYRTSNGTLWNLGAWDESYDGSTTTIDIDLSALAGASVQFILGMTNHGNFQDANGFWFVPHVEGAAPTNQLLLNWHRVGGLRNACDDLRITLTGRRAGEAVASTCRNNNRELGRSALTSQELNQLLDWYDKYSTFNADVYTSATEDPVTAYLVFNGRGRSEALSTDINTITNFAESLFNQLSR